MKENNSKPNLNGNEDICNCSSNVYISTGRFISIEDTDKKLTKAVKEIDRQEFLDGIKSSIGKLFIRRSDK